MEAIAYRAVMAVLTADVALVNVTLVSIMIVTTTRRKQQLRLEINKRGADIMSNQTDLQQTEEFVLKLIKSGRVYTAQEKADMRAKATLITDSVTEAAFNDNKGNDLLAGLANSIRRPFEFPLIAKVSNSAVHRPSAHEILTGHKMFADVVGDGEKFDNAGAVNISMEVQEEKQQGFAERGTISPANVMQKNFDKGAKYTHAPDVMGINILGFRLPRLDYTKHFCTGLAYADLKHPGQFFLAEKYNNFFIELTKMTRKRNFPADLFGEEFRELWEICKMFKSNMKQQEELIRMNAVASPVALQVADALREALGEPGVVESALEKEMIMEALAQRDLENKAEGEARGEIRGEIKVYFNKLNYSIQQIAQELGITEKEVTDVLKELKLV